VVVGAGHAGGTFVGLLRQGGFEGDILLFGAEPYPPYHRPPLSKQFLGEERVQWLRDPQFYADQTVILGLGETVVDIDAAAQTVCTSRGITVAYDVLVLATGARPRTLALPGAAAPGILTLRTLDDAALLSQAVQSGGPLAIVGGGYVGLEVAGVARAAGVPVTVIEREGRVLSRVASPVLSEVLTDHHRAQGTEILTDAEVAGFEGDARGLSGVYLADGSRVAARAAVVGVGAVPCDELAQKAGLARGPLGGVLVDETTRTSVPGVLAIGDVTARRRPRSGAMRFESIPSAVEQAKQAAACVLGKEPPAAEIPWFWSDQLGLKLKITGILEPPYETVVRGDTADGSFALFHHRDGHLVAVEAANANAEFMAAKRILSRRQPVDPTRLGNPDVPLRELAIA